MKNFVRSILLLLTLCLLLGGCGGNDPVDTNAIDLVESDAPPTDSQTENEQTTGGSQQVSGDVNMWKYTTSGGVNVREITIDSGKGGDDVHIVHLTDIHINYCTAEDLKDPVLKSTYENRVWLKNFAVKANLERCLNFAKDADQIVITGDIYDYLSQGAINMTKQYIFDPYPTVMACLGNHESVRKCQGTVAENTSFEQRMAILEQNWVNDIYYASRVIGDKVMVITMDNGSRGGTGSFWDCQVEPFRKDLATARENGYVVLVFYHIPISTGNAKYYNTRAIQIGDKNSSVQNFFSKGIGSTSIGADKEIYDLIINNGDIIKGTFSGHHHNDFYTEIKAKTPSGEQVMIPQYVVNGVPYGTGNAMSIIVK